jgi:hypothetical protein
MIASFPECENPMSSPRTISRGGFWACAFVTTRRKKRMVNVLIFSLWLIINRSSLRHSEFDIHNPSHTHQQRICPILPSLSCYVQAERLWHDPKVCKKVLSAKIAKEYTQKTQKNAPAFARLPAAKRSNRRTVGTQHWQQPSLAKNINPVSHDTMSFAERHK